MAPYDPEHLESVLVSRSKVFARTVAITIVAVGTLALIGWTFNIPVFKSIYGEITMKANTAIGLLLAGTSLLILTLKQRQSLKLLGEACAGFVALLGILTLSEHLIGWDLGIDQFFFKEQQGALATASPGRMGPPASTCYLLSGAAMLFLFRRRAVQLSQAFALGVILLATLPILGYAYRAEQLYGIARYSGIALHTAVSLLLLGIALLSVRIGEGLTAVLSRNDIAGAMARRLLIPAIAVPFSLAWILLIGQRADLYDLGFGTALFAVAIMSFFSFAIWRTASTLARMEQQSIAAESALRASEERFQVAIKHAPVIVFNHDVNLRYTWIHNPALGYRVEEIIGKRDDDLVPKSDAEILMQIKRSVIETGISSRQEVTITFAGTQRYYDLSVEPLRDDTGTIVGVTCAAVDITEMKVVEAQLRKANQLKDEFLATISHELRTPLNSILGWATMLQQEHLEEPVARRAMETIERSARIQAQLIEDLLDVSRIVSGKLRLDTKSIELNPVIQGAIDSVRHAAEAKHIEITTDLDPSAGLILGDPTRLQQVVWNLLSNAVKFTARDGAVQVKLDSSDGKIRMTVTDNGEGISPEFLPYVFDRFQQADGTMTRKHGGLGLGLAIVRHLVEMHGGTIQACSDGLGKGATFQMELPLLERPKEVMQGSVHIMKTAAELPSDAIDPRLSGMKILIVDDESDAREMLNTLLGRYGASTTLAASAQEALNAVLKSRPDLLVCDIGMPDEDGYSLIRKVRAMQETDQKGIPAIALTGYVRVEERVRALREGFQMFVAKPVEPDELISSIVSLIGAGTAE